MYIIINILLLTCFDICTVCSHCSHFNSKEIEAQSERNMSISNTEWILTSVVS